MRSILLDRWAIAAVVGALGCGASDTNSQNGGATGGSAAVSGGASTGGNAQNSGGTPSGGSAVATGGAAVSGGVTSSGGIPASGGVTDTTGGTTAMTGGTTGTSGGSGTGGTTGTTGGTTGTTGGTTGTTGGSGTGGVGTGGAVVATGGTATGGTGPAGTPVAQHGQLSVSGTHLVDQNANPVQLKGPSSMWLNWENDGFASDRATLQWVRDQWGAKVVRAAMGITTTDRADPDYLTDPTEATRRLTAVVDNAIALGMYVIIDWHDSTANQHQTQAVSFFTQMAQTYGNTPNVLYETFNEPTTQAWSTVIKPYHAAVVAAIRQYDPDNVIILGTRTWSQRPDEAAADPVAGSNLMYTMHFYSCAHAQAIRAYGDTALAAGAPIFVTEWGATAADGGVAPRDGGTAQLCLDEARLWHAWMNTNQISWCAWKFDNCTDLTCYFKSTVTLTQTQGTWTDDLLNGHATFVRGCMQGACP